MFLKPSLTDPTAPVREEDLKLPALMVLAKAKEAKLNGLTGAELVNALESITIMSDADRAKTPNDRVSRFTRQVLNLLSHGSLQDAGLISVRATKADKDQVKRYYITSKGRAELAKQFIQGIGMPASARPAPSSESRTLEKAIARPALFVLAHLEMAMGGPVPMTTLRTALRTMLPQSEADLTILKNRKDTRIDQVIRNLISHNTLTENGWVKRTETGAMSLSPAGYGIVLDSLLRHMPTPPLAPFVKPEVAPTLAAAVNQGPTSPAPVAPTAKDRPRPSVRPR